MVNKLDEIHKVICAHKKGSVAFIVLPKKKYLINKTAKQLRPSERKNEWGGGIVCRIKKDNMAVIINDQPWRKCNHIGDQRKTREQTQQKEDPYMYIYPTPPHVQDATQGQLLSRVQ